jgi:hypothetical protein
LEVRVTPEAADVVRRTAREVQQLIASEPAVDGLAGIGAPDEPVEDSKGAQDAYAELQGMLDAGTLAGLAGLGGEVPPLSEDPALARLFPVAYDDADQAEEYRRYTYTELHAAKVAGLEQVARQLTDLAPDIVLDEESAQVWLSALNDMRLVVGSRIGLTEDNADELHRLPADDSLAVLADVYDLLTLLQGTLVEALAGW